MVTALTCNRLQGRLTGINLGACHRMTAGEHVATATDPIAGWTAGQADVRVLADRAAMGRDAARAIAARMRSLADSQPGIRMIFAAAPSQSDVLDVMTTLPDLPWGKVAAFHMDDYLDLPADAPQRFANWLDAHLFSRVALGRVHRIPATGLPHDICRDYAAELAAAPIDIVCLGIGVNGHIAFNDPPVADFGDPADVKVVELDAVCRQQQVDDGCFAARAEVPTHAVTLTIPRLLNADALFCVVPGAQKRAAVQAALEGPVSTECPASILRTHANCTVFLDPEARPHGG